MTGLVSKYFEIGGYGFIRPLVGVPEATTELFFHRTAIIGKNGKRPAGLPVGCEVRFDLVRGNKGPQCINVEPRHLRKSRVMREVLRGAE